MEQVEGEGEEGESPFSQLGVIPETPTSSQDCEVNEEREEGEIKERHLDNSVASSTIVISPDTMESCAAACNDRDSVSIGESTRNEDTVQCIPIAMEESQQQTDLSSELAESAMGDYLPLETRQIESVVPPSTSSGCQEGEPLVDEVIGESCGEEEVDVEEECAAIGVEGVEVKQELLEEEECEPQARYSGICIHGSLGQL